MVRITSLVTIIPLVSSLASALSSSYGLTARQSVVPSSLPSSCQSSCQVLNAMSACASDLSCLCANTIGTQLLQCMNCAVAAAPNAGSYAQAAIDGWNQACNGELSLSNGSSSSGGSGPPASGGSGSASATSGSTPASSTGSAPSGGGGGSAPNPLGVNGAAGGVQVKAGTAAMCLVAAFVGAFVAT